MLTLLSRAWRSWNSAKGAAVLAIVALAIGIGSSTAIYTHRGGERWVALFGSSVKNPGSSSGLNFTDLQEYKTRSQSFDVLGGYRFENFNLTKPGQAQHLVGVHISPSVVLGVGVEPLKGRWFGEDSADGPGSTVVVIAHSLWQRLGGNPGYSHSPSV